MERWLDVVRVAEPDRDYLSLAEVGRPDDDGFDHALFLDVT